MNYPIVSPDKSKPAKREQSLTKKQQAFVKALITTGGDLTAAAQILGYVGRKAEQAGWYIWRSERVRAAYKEALWDKLGRGAGVAVNTLVDLAAAGPAKVRREAADSILDRLGFKEAQQQGAAGITINIGIGKPGDTGATQTIEHEPQVIDVHGLVDGGTSDDASSE